jgi:hypothetical protein
LQHWTSKLDGTGWEPKIMHITSAPSICMIESVIDNLNNFLFEGEIFNYEIIIGLDYKDCELDEIYYQNLLKLKNNHKNIKIQKNYHPKWREDFRYSFSNNFYNMFEQVQTKYYLLMEHDWWFTKKLNINEIMNTFETYQNINYIRFNHSKNIKGTAYTSTVADHFVLDKNIKTMCLSKTDFFSNNPSFMRTSFMQKYLQPQTRLMHKDGPVEGAWSIMQRCCWNEFGFDQAHELYGTYMYGKDGDESIIRHLDGNTWNP